MYFHAHARRKLIPDRVVDGATLSPREFQCLEWAAQGKTARETARIIGISRHTVATYLDRRMRLPAEKRQATGSIGIRIRSTLPGVSGTASAREKLRNGQAVRYVSGAGASLR
jgi:DNA-binding CsgD family transcriptional regulator